jgi:organic radical activating enzyme
MIFAILFFFAKAILNIICSKKTSKKERRKDEKALEYLFNEVLNDSNELKYLKRKKYTNRNLYNKVLDEIMTSKKDYIFEKYCNEKEQEEKNKECLNEVLSNIENV